MKGENVTKNNVLTEAEINTAIETVLRECTDYERDFLKRISNNIVEKEKRNGTSDETIKKGFFQKILHEVIRLAILADKHIVKK